MPCYPGPNQIGSEEATRGTETSKYPEEQKSTEIARVAASESAPAQTHARASLRALLHAVLWDRPSPGPQTWGGVTKLRGSGTAWKGRPQRVRAPYAKPRSLRSELGPALRDSLPVARSRPVVPAIVARVQPRA